MSSRRSEPGRLVTQAPARRGPTGVLAVDVPAALNLVGTLVKYLGPAALFPTAVAIGYGETFWPYLLAGGAISGGGYLLERLTAGSAGRVGVREGFLVVSLTWLLAPAFAALPYLFIGGDQLGHPLDAYFEGMSGFTTTGASRRHRLRRDLEVARHVAPVHAVDRRHRDRRPRDRGPAAPPGRRTPAARVRAARPRDRPALGADPRDGAPAVGALRRAHRDAHPASRRASAGSASTTA